MSSPFLYLRRINRLDELGETFIDRAVMPLKYKDGRKTNYASKRTILPRAS